MTAKISACPLIQEENKMFILLDYLLSLSNYLLKFESIFPLKNTMCHTNALDSVKLSIVYEPENY